MVLDVDRAVFGDIRRQLVLVAHALHQSRRPLVDEPLRQPLMQRVRQLILDLARPRLPMGRILEPVRAVRYERPGADMGQPVRQRIDIAIRAIRERNLLGKPIFGYPLVASTQRLVKRTHELSMVRRRNLAIIRDLAHVPQQFDRSAIIGEVRQLGIARNRLERRHIVGHPRARQARHTRNFAQRFPQRKQRREVHNPVAPLQRADRLEVVIFQPFDEIRIHRLRAASNAKRPVVHVPPRAARDLSNLARREVAMVLPIELAQRRQRHMIEIEVQPHPDRVRRHDVIDIARLIELDLRIARARRQRPDHDRSAALLTPDQLGNRINFRRRKRDDGRPLGQPR